VYSAGNSFNCTSTQGFYRYNPLTDVWVTLPNPPNRHEEPIAGVIGGKLYLVGTAADHSTSPGVRALDVYDPATNSWTTRAPLPAVQEYSAGAALLGKLYVVGGQNSSGTVVGNTRAYDPATNTWTDRASMPTARTSAAGINSGGRLWIISGAFGHTANQAYTP
jgi:N-acetylneuraminic acid mutarotase